MRLPETVVLVHGLWMNGLEMSLLRWRLAESGYCVRRFSYASVRAPLVENAVRLQRFLERLDADTVHFVGHSLGGLVILKLFEAQPAQRPGRVVLLGSPLAGSSVARHLSHHPLGRLLLGRTLDHALLGDGPGWRGGRDLGVIAGTINIGMGRLFGAIQPPADGIVAVAETRLPTVTDHITLPAMHTGLLFSQAVARQTSAFLSTGRFRR